MVEILVVIGILVFVISFGAVIDLGAFTSNSLQGEQSRVVSILSRARSRAMANMFESSYGVCYSGGHYIIFRNSRTTCLPTDSTDETVIASSNISASFNPNAPVIFSRLSGNTTASTINLTDGTKSASITINNEGRINW